MELLHCLYSLTCLILSPRFTFIWSPIFICLYTCSCRSLSDYFLLMDVHKVKYRDRDFCGLDLLRSKVRTCSSSSTHAHAETCFTLFHYASRAFIKNDFCILHGKRMTSMHLTYKCFRACSWNVSVCVCVFSVIRARMSRSPVPIYIFDYLVHIYIYVYVYIYTHIHIYKKIEWTCPMHGQLESELNLCVRSGHLPWSDNRFKLTTSSIQDPLLLFFQTKVTFLETNARNPDIATLAVRQSRLLTANGFKTLTEIIIIEWTISETPQRTHRSCNQHGANTLSDMWKYGNSTRLSFAR